MSTISNKRRFPISLKMLASQRRTIDRAANIAGKNRSQFIIESSVRAAEDIILDQVIIKTADDASIQFQEALIEPANPKMAERLLAHKALWDD